VESVCHGLGPDTLDFTSQGRGFWDIFVLGLFCYNKYINLHRSIGSGYVEIYCSDIEDEGE
jgi:hypothetical protein